MRTLLHFPIVHHPIEMLTQEDYDTLCHAVPDRLKEFNEEYDQCWERIDMYLRDRVVHKVYQDSHWGNESKEIFRERKSRNDQRIFQLVASGAQLIPTEDARLLMAESRGIKRIDGRDVTWLRDFHIAETIRDTLQEEETGVLFIGKAHTLFRIPFFRIQTETYDAGFDQVYNSAAALHWLGEKLAEQRNARLRAPTLETYRSPIFENLLDLDFPLQIKKKE